MSNISNLISECYISANVNEILISSDSKNKPEVNPYSGLENVEFQHSFIRITIPKVKPQKTKLLFYEWSGSKREISNYFTINGIIKVPNRKVNINNELNIIPWKAPFVDILIAFDKSEYFSRNVQTVRFYFAPAYYKKWYKRLLSNAIKNY